MRRLAAYPIIFVIVWIPTFINRIQNAIDPMNPSYVLYFLTAVVLPLNGFLNAIVYGVNEKLTFLYWKWWNGLGRDSDSTSDTNENPAIAMKDAT